MIAPTDGDAMDKIPYPTITEDGQATHVVVPLEDYLALVEDNEYPPYDDTIVKDGGTPLAVSKAALLGENPLKAWRKHMGLTQEDEIGRAHV
jgi:hypothetical protein